MYEKFNIRHINKCLTFSPKFNEEPDQILAETIVFH